MAISNGYCTLAEIKARLDIDTDDTTDDAMIEDMVEAVSRWIDETTGRRFYQASETRYYCAEFWDLLEVDDLTAVSALVTDTDGDRSYETTWAATDYDLLPVNAALAGKPYTQIAVSPAGRYAFPAGMAKGVKVTGTFGYWATVPADVKEPCLLLCEYVFQRHDAILGVLGTGEFATALRTDGFAKDIVGFLRPYGRMRVRGI